MLDLLSAHLRMLGVFAILLCVGTWALDLTGLVHPCVYCRTQRTAIGIVGALMMLPHPKEWWVRYPAAVVCFFGANVAVAQLFLIVKSINAGEPFGGLNLFMASGSLCTLCGQALLLYLRDESATRPIDGDGFRAPSRPRSNADALNSGRSDS